MSDYKSRKVYLFGGEDLQGKEKNSLWCMGMDTFNWKKIPPIKNGYPAPKLHSAISCLYKDLIIVIGGEYKSTRLDTIFIYNIKTNKWILCESKYSNFKKISHSQPIRYNNFLFCFTSNPKKPYFVLDLQALYYNYYINGKKLTLPFQNIKFKLKPKPWKRNNSLSSIFLISTTQTPHGPIIFANSNISKRNLIYLLIPPKQLFFKSILKKMPFSDLRIKYK